MNPAPVSLSRSARVPDPDARPWHEVLGMEPAELGANLAAVRAETAGLTSREKNSALWKDAYARLRDAGFEPAAAATMAGAEVRTAPRASAISAAPRPAQPANAALYPLTDGLTLDGPRLRRASDYDQGRAVHCPDHAAGPGPALDTHDAVTTARADLVQQAEMDFLADCTAETGAVMSPEKWEKMRKNRAKLREQSARIIALLAESNIPGKRSDTAKVFAYSVHSEHVEELPAYRRICLIPEVASMVRAPKLAALEYWLDRHPYARFWTFTTGERCGLDALGKRIKWLHRKLSKLNHELARFGAEIVFRSTEYGSLEKKTDFVSERLEGGGLEFDSTGAPLFHPHSHCVVVAHFGYNPARWQALTQHVRDFWQSAGRRLHCDFGEIIGNARECCKYVTKPGDLLKLTPAAIARLFEITYRAKLCQPMGSLAREIRIRKGHVVQILRAGPAAERRAEVDAYLDAISEVPECEFVGNRQARSLRQLAAKHRVPLAALVAQNPGLPADPDAALDYGARIIIHPGGRCLRRVREGRRMVWRERLDHNKAARETPAERAERQNLEDAFAMTAECARAASLPCNISLPLTYSAFEYAHEFTGPHHPESYAAPGARRLDYAADFIGPRAPLASIPWETTRHRLQAPGRIGSASQVMARLMPGAGPTRVKEPRVIVMSLDGRLDLAAVREHPLVASLWADTVHEWEAGCALLRSESSGRYSVHTVTPTVHGHPETGHPAPSYGPPDPFRAELEARRALAEGINF